MWFAGKLTKNATDDFLSTFDHGEIWNYLTLLGTQVEHFQWYLSKREDGVSDTTSSKVSIYTRQMQTETHFVRREGDVAMDLSLSPYSLVLA